ncbi:trans-4-hydroxy-L-proline dehydratase [Desulfospira joergensenii]|uniref:trans-4-hydroxy-L-proline dehydratase n=1 Tax=Desulfospira joergensenii TaxID=53329 RepID=UPI0003B45B02|nr:trans-4-hydroxy-L-proline dehydratase [Desulfospira joergensenii]
MNSRVERLRQKSLDRKVTLSHERAELVTQFYKTQPGVGKSVPVQRALCLKHILSTKKIFIDDGELIVGERAPQPKAVPTYPEICLHSLEDLEVLDTRPKVAYGVSDETKEIYEQEIIPFWRGKSIREKIFASMDPSWIDAFEAGIFTEFQEQRSPGHTAGGDLIYSRGFNDLKADIKKHLAGLDFFEDPSAMDRQEVLRSLDIAADALILFARRHAKALDRLAEEEKDPQRKDELAEMAAVCRRVPENRPRTFHEALQYYWFLHVGIITELNPWDAYNPGRLDQNLYPFYKKDIEEGRLTKERAKELLSCFWIKFHNHPAPPKVGITAKESNTYVDFCLINLGGVTPDNRDGVNDLTYLILEVIQEMRLLQPSSMIQVSRKNPDRFIRRALDIIATGFGQPSVFNTDAIVQEMSLQGKSVEDARKAGASGCVEAGAFGREAYILTGYFNLPKIFEITLNNGLDPRTGKKIGLETGDPNTFDSFDKLLDAYSSQVRHFVDIKIKGSNIIEQINARYMPVPLLSLVTEDCIQNGKDYNQGGARYNTSYIQGVGMGTITDCLAAVKIHVYDQKSMTMAGLRAALEEDFKGHDIIRHQLLKSPKYGNDNPVADGILRQVFDVYHRAVTGRPNARGGVYRINLLPTTCHVYFGEITGALPDGRQSGLPLSEGISPVQGADHCGPTAVLKSAGKIDHLRTGGTLLNQKFLPDFLENETGRTALVHLIRSYFKMDGHHIQFNVVDEKTLRKAQKNPENYRDLIVRVAGYSDYFVDLTEALQEEVICRTAHAGS